MESAFGEVTHALRLVDGDGDGLCSCGQRHCDYDLAPLDRERTELAH
jgi:hypothetical protein